MKRLMWIAGMVSAAAVALLPTAPTAAYAFLSCDDIECKRNNQCTVQCSYCDTESPIIPGNCALN